MLLALLDGVAFGTVGVDVSSACYLSLRITCQRSTAGLPGHFGAADVSGRGLAAAKAHVFVEIGRWPRTGRWRVRP
jgi:hypothetical protein